MTGGGGPAEPGGTPRAPECGTLGPRRSGERGGQADEVVDLRDIRRTEEILDALAANLPRSCDAGRADADEPAVAVLAALAADVRCGAGSPGYEDPARDESFRRRLHAACGRGAARDHVAGPGAGAAGGSVASRLGGMKSAVTAAAAATAVATSGVAAAGLHGRLPGLVGAAGRRPVTAAQAPRTAGQRPSGTSTGAAGAQTLAFRYRQ